MDRRQYLSILGTTGAGAGVLLFGYHVRQGTIDLGESSAVSEEVHDGGKTFPFEATAGDEIFITVRERNDDVSAGVTLRDPDGNDVAERRLRSAREETRETHTAEQSGTYRLSVGTRGRVHVTVAVTDPDE